MRDALARLEERLPLVERMRGAHQDLHRRAPARDARQAEEAHLRLVGRLPTLPEVARAAGGHERGAAEQEQEGAACGRDLDRLEETIHDQDRKLERISGAARRLKRRLYGIETGPFVFFGDERLESNPWHGRQSSSEAGDGL